MADGFGLAVVVKMRLNIIRAYLEVLMQECAQVGGAVAGTSQKFHAIAGAKNQAFVDTGVLDQPP
jgi:hypothetical protein